MRPNGDKKENNFDSFIRGYYRNAVIVSGTAYWQYHIAICTVESTLDLPSAHNSSRRGSHLSTQNASRDYPLITLYNEHYARTCGNAVAAF